MDFEALKQEPRLLLQVELVPAQGTRFQPTGFPDLGAADYQLTDGTRMVLVESAQSMANRMEAVCWDDNADDLVAPLKGLPYVRAELPDGTRTDSIREAHRLNSPYIVNSPEFAETIEPAIGFDGDHPFDRRALARALLRFDPNSIVHGIFLEKVGGVVRIPRMLSGFIEARGVTVIPSGGVKIDRVQPATAGDNTTYGKADEGYGNVPYHRDEYAAESITCYFNVDLALLHGYALGEAAEHLLIGLSLFKIRRFLDEGLRLRTACCLDAKSVAVTRPANFELPSSLAIADAMPALITSNAKSFNEPRVLVARYEKGTKKKKKKD